MSSISNTNTAYVEGYCRVCGHFIQQRVYKQNPDGARVRCGDCGKTTFFDEYKPRYQLTTPEGED